MACFATPYGLRYAAHCFNRAHAQKDGSTLIPAGGKLGVMSKSTNCGYLVAGSRPPDLYLVDERNPAWMR